MKKFVILISTLFVSISIISAQAGTAGEAQSKSDNIDQLMNHCYDNGMFNGAILVIENGNIIYRNAFGFADKEAKQKLTPQSAFYLASVSKQFTSMAIMMLKEQKKLSYSDPLSKYFPEFPEYADELTIRHMMTHTSGIPDHYGLNAYKVDLKNSDVLALLIQQDSLDFPPGEQYSYSNGAYVMLAMIAEKASGMPFSQFMEENIFEPLGMAHTLVFDELEPKVANRALGYNGAGELDDYEIFTTGAGGMFSNVDDLLLWDQALYTEKLVSKKALQEAYTPTKLNNGEVSNYGYGWSVKEDGDHKVVSHSGSMNGYRTFIRRDLSNRNAHMILTNKGASVAMGEINSAIAHILDGESFDLPKISIAGQVEKLMKENIASIAIEKASLLLKEKEDKYVADEGDINRLGYQYLSKKEYENALAIFQMNIDLNPSSANTYDSMGEAYMKSGDNENAIKLYKKSVELNPNNTIGIQMLADMGVNTDDLFPTVNIAEDVLETYVGKYELTPGFILTISRKGKQMFIHPSGQSISEIFASNETRFFSKVVDAQITFNVDSDGQVGSLTLHQGGDTLAKRVE